MTFSVDDYERAIARIFDNQGHVIGTGFLVAPGYVLTCAHVVLQAIGIAKEKFAEYEEQPQRISLDFHVLASGQPIEADVVAWLPYSLESGDVAVLKLRTSEPEGAKPIPLDEVSRAEVENDEHSAYGFGNNVGGRSDAYRPKTTVAGGRFQLCKVGDANDETIQPGFSGSPVWNGARKRVIGMVATAFVPKDEQKSKAYVIPTKELRPVLKQVDALYLHDVLAQSLEACGSADEKERLQIAIAATLRRCNPSGGDRPWQAQLVDLSIDRAPTLGWEVEGRLVHFAVMLARMDDTPPHTSEQIEAWVERCGFRFSDLFVRIDREMKQQKVPSSNICQHLMVAVEPKETSADQLRVTLWVVPDRETYDPRNPPLPLVSEQNVAIAELPGFIRKQIRKRLRRTPTPTIHLFVPRSLFNCDVEMQPSSKLGAVLGGEYPFVLRTNLKTHPIGSYYYDDWHEKWEQLEKSYEDKTCEVFKPINCALPDRALIAELETINAAMLVECNSVSELFELIADETALPVALWSRNPQFQDGLADVLDCVVKRLPHRIQQERGTARNSTVNPEANPLLGHHLSLIWEDPKIVPPDMQFDPEAC
ncbi:MAG TPA: trypsin-like peptidase domain-containing protein [Coleofasciculaceae cyanobacterium]|jgi:hypothetical protein